MDNSVGDLEVLKNPDRLLRFSEARSGTKFVKASREALIDAVVGIARYFEGILNENTQHEPFGNAAARMALFMCMDRGYIPRTKSPLKRGASRRSTPVRSQKALEQTVHHMGVCCRHLLAFSKEGDQQGLAHELFGWPFVTEYAVRAYLFVEFRALIARDGSVVFFKGASNYDAAEMSLMEAFERFYSKNRQKILQIETGYTTSGSVITELTPLAMLGAPGEHEIETVVEELTTVSEDRMINFLTTNNFKIASYEAYIDEDFVIGMSDAFNTLMSTSREPSEDPHAFSEFVRAICLERGYSPPKNFNRVDINAAYAFFEMNIAMLARHVASYALGLTKGNVLDEMSRWPPGLQHAARAAIFLYFFLVIDADWGFNLTYVRQDMKEFGNKYLSGKTKLKFYKKFYPEIKRLEEETRSEKRDRIKGADRLKAFAFGGIDDSLLESDDGWFC